MIILDDQAIKFLKKHINVHLALYQLNEGVWIHKKVKGLYELSMMENSSLRISRDPKYDTENAIQFYKENKELSTTLASSNNYWTTIAHTKYYNYMKARWPIEKDTKASFVDTRYFFNVNNQKSRARHGLTRLWWIAHLTYDESNSKDPYYYTKIATKDQELFNLIMETKHIAQNKSALFALLDALTILFKLVEKDKVKLVNKRVFFRRIMQQINLIGSVTVWDMLSKNEAEEKLISFIGKYFNIDLTAVPS